jgi:DNA-binding CsgD family transcriptional regulator
MKGSGLTKRKPVRQERGRGRREFESFVQTLYVPGSEEEVRAAIIANILKVVPGQNAVVHKLELRKRTVQPIFSAHPFSRIFLVGIKNFIHEHPSFRDLEKSPRFHGRLISDFLSPRQWHGTALFNEAYRPEGLEDQIGIRTCLMGESCTGVAVLRDRRGFSAKERERMSLLASHFEQAFLNARALGRLQLSLNETQAQLDALPYGTILLNEKLGVVAINARARALKAEFFPEDGAGRRLPPILREWLGPAIGVRFGNFRPAEPLVRYSGEGRLTIRLISLPDDKLQLLVLKRRSLRPTLGNLRRLGLTGRESEVLLWVAQGKTNEEIACILGGSRRTIDKHVENLLIKLKLANRAGAVLLVAELLES